MELQGQQCCWGTLPWSMAYTLQRGLMSAQLKLVCGHSTVLCWRRYPFTAHYWLICTAEKFGVLSQLCTKTFWGSWDVPWKNPRISKEKENKIGQETWELELWVCVISFAGGLAWWHREHVMPLHCRFLNVSALIIMILTARHILALSP